MMASLRVLCVAASVAAATACGGRAVEVRTAPTTTSNVAVQVTNNLSQAVNIYATATGSAELFLRQITANTVEKVPVQGAAIGTKVTFKAVTVDGSRTYQSRDVTLSGLYVWSVP